MANRWGNSDRFYFLGLQNHCGQWLQHEIKRHLLLERKAKTNLDRVLKNRDITLPTKVCIVKAIVFPAVTYRCENWSVKKAELQCFWTVVLEKTLESPLSTKEIKPVKPKGNQPWILIGRTNAEAPILWPPDAKSIGWLIGKGPDAGKDWGQEAKGTAEDEMAGWHYRLNGQEFE